MTTTPEQLAAELLDRLSDESDLCRNDGADDIARLLDDAQAGIRTLSTQVEQLTSAHAVAVEIGAQYAAERDSFRAELAALREFVAADLAVSRIYDEVSPGLTTPPGPDHHDRLSAAIKRRKAALDALPPSPSSAEGA